MSAVWIDGKKVAAEVTGKLHFRVQRLLSQGVAPQLAVVLVGGNPASLSYIRAKRNACQKIGIATRDIHLPTTTTQGELLQHLRQLNADASVHAILLQLPLPAHISAEVLTAIDPRKDVDGFHPCNMGGIVHQQETLAPCTPLGIIALLKAYHINTSGMHVVIVGRSTIVGRPLALLLMQKSQHANATVTVCHSHSRNIAAITSTADILVAAMGRPAYITNAMIKEGAVVIDVGVNRVSDTSDKGYHLCGDVASEVHHKAGYLTPVPGGVGPMTIAMLLHNTIVATELQLKE